MSAVLTLEDAVFLSALTVFVVVLAACAFLVGRRTRRSAYALVPFVLPLLLVAVEVSAAAREDEGCIETCGADYAPTIAALVLAVVLGVALVAGSRLRR